MEQKFLLSNLVIENLKQLGDNSSLKLIENVAQKLLSDNEHQSPANTQPLEYAIVTLFTEATKHCCDAYALRKALGEHNLQSDILEELVRIYTQHHKEFILRQMQIGPHFPQVNDVQWRIVKDITSSIGDANKEDINFEITLGHYNKAGEFSSVVQFYANTEELQSMISKLKEVERHCEKFANE